MLGKKFASVCILVLMFSFLTVEAHQGADPGPTIIEGHISGMSNLQDFQIGYDRNVWTLTDVALDAQRNIMLGGNVSLTKRLYYDIQQPPVTASDRDYYATGGTSHTSVMAVPTVAGFATRGDYYIKARARGKWFWGSRKLKNSYNSGTYQSVRRHAYRKDDDATWSGVHLWGKSEIDNQFAEVEAVFEWL